MRTLAFTILCLFANITLAQSIFEKLDRFYVGANLTAIDGNMKNTDGVSAHFVTLELNGGFKQDPWWLGAEARVGLGINEQTIFNPNTGSGQPATLDVRVDNHASIYWRPETANPVAKLYGLVGATSMTVDSESRSGASYGGGVGFKAWENWNINVEYRLLFKDDNDDFNAFSFGVDYRF